MSTGKTRWNPPDLGSGVVRLLACAHTPVVSGGSEIVLLRTLRAAHDAGWDVGCVAPPGALAEELVRLGVRWLPGPDLRLGSAPAAVAGPQLAARWATCATRLRRWADKVDVVLVNGIRALPPVSAARTKAPVVLLAHDVLARRGFIRLARWGLHNVDHVVAVSRVTSAPFERFGLPTSVIYNGTTWPVEPAPLDSPEPPIVGNAAAITPWKGQAVLIEAMARVQRADLHLELLGTAGPKDGGYLDDLRHLTDLLGLADRVHFRGHVGDPLDHVRRWAIAVVASTDPEPGPLTMIEAMSVGVPVVATAHGGPRELLGDAGLLVAPGDPSAMAGAIDRLLGEPALRLRCREAGRSKVARDLVADERTAELLDILAGLARRGRGVGRAVRR